MAEIIRPTVVGMRRRHFFHVGAGLMITGDGPKLIEYNVRFGDPKRQVLMMRLMSDLLPVLLASAEGQLAHTSPVLAGRVAFCVVMAANGYPGSYKKGPRSGALRVWPTGGDVIVFHAGTSASATSWRPVAGFWGNRSTLTAMP